jgi:hypothetical protein
MERGIPDVPPEKEPGVGRWPSTGLSPFTRSGPVVKAGVLSLRPTAPAIGCQGTFERGDGAGGYEEQITYVRERFERRGSCWERKLPSSMAFG